MRQSRGLNSLFFKKKKKKILKKIYQNPQKDYNVEVEKVVKLFNSFEDADEADARDDAAMSPERRLRILTRTPRPPTPRCR